MNKKLLFMNVFILLLAHKTITTFGFSNYGSYQIELMKDRSNAKTNSLFQPLSLVEHSPIIISEDSDIPSWLPGIGTSVDPYRIENFNIMDINYCISISDTTKHFLIQNCYIKSGSIGIRIQSVANGTIEIKNNFLQGENYHMGSRGISSCAAPFAYIYNNTCTGFDEGIVVHSSPNTTLTENICYTNLRCGIHVSDAESTKIVDNLCNDNPIGIELGFSTTSVLVDNNLCISNGIGIFVDNYVTELQIYNNRLFSNFIYFNPNLNEKILTFTLENNTIDSKPLGFFIELPEKTIIENPDYGQLYLINCQNIIVYQQHCNSIILLNCDNSVIENNTCLGNGGIILIDSSFSRVYNNTCKENASIHLLFCPNSEISKNTILLNDISIISFPGLYSSSASCINLYYSDSSKISQNICINNTAIGIKIEGSVECTITNNICHANREGIILSYTDTCVLNQNILLENEQYGIHLVSSNNNDVFHNIFIYNNLEGTSQAYDDGTQNIWYNENKREGNCWSDWQGEEEYNIDGPAYSSDDYPLNDTDNDGLNDYDELYIFSTDPFLVDTDGDGYSDGDEVEAGTDPNDSESFPEDKVDFLNVVFIFISLLSFTIVLNFRKKTK